MNKYSILIAELQEGSLIGIDAPLDFLKTNSICVSGDNIRYFVSDREGYEININSNELYFVENTNTTKDSLDFSPNLSGIGHGCRRRDQRDRHGCKRRGPGPLRWRFQW